MNVAQRLVGTLTRQEEYGIAELRGDILGGLTAGSIALPATIGYGAISGLGPIAGIYGAVAVSFFAAIFGGTRGLTSGPNILVTLTMAVVVAEHADTLAEAFAVAIMAGLIQIAFGLLGLGRYVAYLPYSLTAGFFTGFGLLFLIKQGLLALGASPEGNAIDSVKAWPEAIREVNLQALALASICVALGLLWRGRLLKISPAPFVVLVVGTGIGVAFFQDAPIIGEIPRGLPRPELPDISWEFLLGALEPAFAMALLSSMSTLILAIHVDAVTGSQHQPNREMMAQGIGNIAAGLVGGSPGGVSPGTLANVQSGGRTAVAGITFTVLLLMVIFALGPVAERIPYPVLAGILLINGWNIINWRFIRRLHRVPRRYALVMLLTCLMLLFVDITAALVIGLVIAAFATYQRGERLEVRSLVSTPVLDKVILEEKDLRDDADPFQAGTGLVRFPDRVTVASAREVSRILRPDIRGHQLVIFDMSRTEYIDDTAAVIISGLVKIAQRSRTIVISGLQEEVSDMFDSLHLLDHVPPENIVADMEEAKQIIRPLLRGE